MSTPRSRPGPLAARIPIIASALAVGGAAYFFFARRPPQPEGTSTKISGTQGMQNIESAYTNAGATSTHTKAYGGTPLGDKKNENLRENAPAGTATPKGVNSGPFGDEQRPSSSTKAEKKFQQSNYGSDEGK